MKPRVLIFIDWFAPGYKAGGPTTSNVNIVDHLNQWFDFYIITSDTDYHAQHPYSDIIPDRWTDRGNCKVWYCSRQNTSLAALKRAAVEADCNVWYINGIYSRFFSMYPLLLRRILHPGKVIVSARGMLSPQAFTIKPMMKNIFISLMKFAGNYRGIVFHGTNEEECYNIRSKISPRVHCQAIENLPRKLNILFSPPSKQPNAVRLVSFARISPEKNTLYALQALRYCKAQVTYDIYGQINSESYWKDCQDMMAQLPANVQVNYRGSVEPSLMTELYRTYDALYLPTTGENFGHAILECFMNSRPAIISDTTPWRDLTAKGIGADLDLTSQRSFSEIIDKMADMSSEDFGKLCETSYRFATEFCNSNDNIGQYKRLFYCEKRRSGII